MMRCAIPWRELSSTADKTRHERLGQFMRSDPAWAPLFEAVPFHVTTFFTTLSGDVDRELKSALPEELS